MENDKKQNNIQYPYREIAITTGFVISPPWILVQHGQFSFELIPC